MLLKISLLFSFFEAKKAESKNHRDKDVELHWNTWTRPDFIEWKLYYKFLPAEDNQNFISQSFGHFLELMRYFDFNESAKIKIFCLVCMLFFLFYFPD